MDKVLLPWERVIKEIHEISAQVTRTVQGSQLRLGVQGRLCGRRDTGVRKGELCKGLGGKHSGQREEQRPWELSEP